MDSLILYDFEWICMDSLDFWSLGLDILWRDLVPSGDRVWTLLLVCKIRSSDDHKDLWCLAWFSMDFIDLR